jgi:hypothetical protein
MKIPTEVLRRLVDEALADPRPSIPARTVFKRLRRHRAKRLEADAPPLNSRAGRIILGKS